MKRLHIQGYLLDRKLDSRVLIALYPVLILLGKVVRWTIMKGTLVGFSKGWGWIDPIMNGGWSWQFFGMDELVEGDVGTGDNTFTFFKFFWKFFWAEVPDSFVSFEIFITVTFGLALLFVLAGMRKRLNLVEASFVALSVMVISVYCFALSKEPFQMAFFFLMYAVLQTAAIPTRYKFTGGLLVILLSASCFRTYYVLIVVFAFVYEILLRALYRPGRLFHHFDRQGRLSWTAIAVQFLCMGVVYFIMMLVLRFSMYELYARFEGALLYASEATSGSNTYMENILLINNSSPNVATVAVEYMLAVVRLLFPLELIGNGPKYWPYVAYQLFMTLFMFRTIRNYSTNTRTQNVAMIIFVGFVFASAAFEVDYGAWVRHCAVTIPVVLVMSGISAIKE